MSNCVNLTLYLWENRIKSIAACHINSTWFRYTARIKFKSVCCIQNVAYGLRGSNVPLTCARALKLNSFLLKTKTETAKKKKRSFSVHRVKCGAVNSEFAVAFDLFTCKSCFLETGDGALWSRCKTVGNFIMQYVWLEWSEHRARASAPAFITLTM